MSGRGLGRGTLWRKKNGRYVFQWTGADRRIRRRVLSTDRRVAERLAADIIKARDLSDRGLGREEGQEQLFADVVARYLVEMNDTRAPGYVDRIKRDLNALI